mmetsp:Transcript_20663/g.51749  ORF Transcript_20663/g.51749 Transcript_20663/m.51749 type:complete len:217 (+) Transcript_20663:295-945(+)
MLSQELQEGGEAEARRHHRAPHAVAAAEGAREGHGVPPERGQGGHAPPLPLPRLPARRRPHADCHQPRLDLPGGGVPRRRARRGLGGHIAQGAGAAGQDDAHAGLVAPEGGQLVLGAAAPLRGAVRPCLHELVRGVRLPQALLLGGPRRVPRDLAGQHRLAGERVHGQDWQAPARAHEQPPGVLPCGAQELGAHPEAPRGPVPPGAGHPAAAELRH